jgi:hypothetical protein
VVLCVENTEDEGERNKEVKKRYEKCVAPICSLVDPSGWRSLGVSVVVSRVCREGGGGGVAEGPVCKHLMDLGGYSYVNW